MKKYILRKWDHTSITEVEVERETDASVWIEGNRTSKKTAYDVYFSSWDEAYSELLARANGRKVSAERNMNVANQELDQIMAMKNP
jgi:hypothetical protein